MSDIVNITFKQFIENCEALKLQYEENFAPFFNTEMVRCWKTMIYSLQMEEWKKDKIWETLNNDFPIEELKKFLER